MKKFEVGKITQLTEDKSKKEQIQTKGPIGFIAPDKKDDSGKRLDKLGFAGKLVEKKLKPNKDEEAKPKDDEEHIVRSEN